MYYVYFPIIMKKYVGKVIAWGWGLYAIYTTEGRRPEAV